MQTLYLHSLLINMLMEGFKHACVLVCVWKNWRIGCMRVNGGCVYKYGCSMCVCIMLCVMCVDVMGVSVCV